MFRTQVQLTETQVDYIRRLARERNVSMAEIIRQAVDWFARNQTLPDRRELDRKALQVIGAFSSGQSDVSTHHDRYLDEVFFS